MRPVHDRIAIFSPGQPTILQGGRQSQLLNQEQAADEKQQDDRHAGETRSLALGSFIVVRLVSAPMVMRVHRILHQGPAIGDPQLDQDNSIA
jgi:hypothetical protein